MGEKKRLVVGISGASGTPIVVELLRTLKTLPGWESHLVISGGGERTLWQESSLTREDLRELADQCYEIDDISASIASGTFHTVGMAVVPCSMKTAAGIACGYSDNLLLRAADVTLKERRRLVVVARETPFHSIHLRNLLTLSDMGAVVLPPMLSYYFHPACVEDLTRHIAGKILDQFGTGSNLLRCWDPKEA